MKPSSTATTGSLSKDAHLAEVKNATKASAERDNDDDDDDDEESKTASDKEDDASAEDGARLLSGPGPYTFFLWADALIDILEEDQEDSYFLQLKSNVLEIYERVAHLPEERHDEEIGELISEGPGVHIWDMELAPERDPATHAKGVAHMTKRKEESDDAKRKMVTDESLKKSYDADVGWWYELVLQKDKPADGGPAMCIDLDYGGKKTQWWFTDFTVVPQGKILSAISCVAEWTSAHDSF